MDIPQIRIGMGYDVHRLVADRELWLCGIKIPHILGLLGHSDADVAIHALCDAMLGAAALRDIGHHFPDKDPRFKGIDSKKLLAEVSFLLKSDGWHLVNADITICAEAPKLNPHIPEMQRTLEQTIGSEPGSVSVKATTTEGLGFTGRREGISAYAVALISK